MTSQNAPKRTVLATGAFGQVGKLCTVEAVNGKVLLIGGDDTHVHTHREVEDDMMAAVGLRPLGPAASLPGNPGDDRGWSFTSWFDTTESQGLLEFQQHDWPTTVAWVTESQATLIEKKYGPDVPVPTSF